jgi:nickel-dependent lactate racemase
MNRIGYQSFQKRMDKFQNTVFISHIGYDPLFGFGGTPTILLRNYVHGQMLESFQARQTDFPQPGVLGPPLKIALSSSEKISAKSIDIVASSSGIAGIYYGNIIEAFHNAVTKLQSISVIEVELAKSAIISASSEIGPHLTLTDSLNSLWNSVHIVKENGSAILIAENRNGIGGGALQMLIEGRLDIEELKQNPAYINGLEHLIYIEELRQKYDLGIVSTLPQHYLKTKLGFMIYVSMKDALEKLLVKHGKSHKVLILSDADIIFLKAI